MGFLLLLLVIGTNHYQLYFPDILTIRDLEFQRVLHWLCWIQIIQITVIFILILLHIFSSVDLLFMRKCCTISWLFGWKAYVSFYSLSPDVLAARIGFATHNVKSRVTEVQSPVAPSRERSGWDESSSLRLCNVIVLRRDDGCPFLMLLESRVTSVRNYRRLCP